MSELSTRTGKQNNNGLQQRTKSVRERDSEKPMKMLR